MRFSATITTDALDRDYEVIVPAGMNAKEYEANPVLLYAHDPLRPIGRMLDMRRSEGSIDADFALAPRPEGHQGEWEADTVGSLLRCGVLRGVSIGCAPMPGGLRNATKADKERYGAAVTRVYSKWKLLEVSIVSLPANAEALVTVVQKGLVTRAALASLGCAVPECAPALPPTTKHTIAITLPALGSDDVAAAARLAIRRARGLFR
jgi:phage head maturation protease